MNNIYVLEYQAYEYDDIDTGGYEPFFISLNEQKVKDEFEKWKANGLSDIEKFDDTELFEDTETIFEYTIGNWIYKYRIVSYPLDKNLRFK